ncbi:zinc-binding dehydrogenase [Thiorhodococcus mannitoliphagus]|uniref:Zinc-binding dehydrogenase n=1 Tax=Thiorhodococcus mannitoliphagus TaxID=329406 RepID=A0A6P1DWT9_9GAMM|nr:zinc-binding dehydrogenase [Thiorhodococcus mannitoliphagus]NEX22149.1 zinc-binding dehydrogenase [Thiorhodococcus mannitoliphagus]
MTTRRAWRMPSAGSLDRLTRVTEELPPPGPGEARVRVEAIGLNFADVFACLGLYSATPRGAFIPGLECAGVVEALGPPRAGDDSAGTAIVAPGDRVMVLTRFGGYATALNVDRRYLVLLPAAWTLAEGAAYLVQALTAWYGLVHLGTLARGQVALVHSAAGGVGLRAVAMARAIGATVIGTVGHADKIALLETQGLPRAQVIVRGASGFGVQLDAALAAIGASHFDVVLDALAGPFFLPGLVRLAPEGRHVLYGAADFMPSGARPSWVRLAWQYLRRPRLDPMKLIDKNRSFMGFNLIWLFERADRLPVSASAALALSPEPAHIGARFGFDEVPRALRTLQSGRTTGKVIVEV